MYINTHNANILIVFLFHCENAKTTCITFIFYLDASVLINKMEYDTVLFIKVLI